VSEQTTIKRIGRKLAWPLRLHASLKQAVEAAAVAYGIGTVDLWRASGPVSFKTFVAVLNDRGVSTPVSLAAAGMVGAILGVPRDETVIGESLPPVPFELVTGCLNKLRGSSQRADIFVDARLRQIEAAESAAGMPLTECESKVESALEREVRSAAR
jgi:hypothetical protein